ncbi:hypothetical protein DET65_1570 [Sunxiuqinia elliptica]|uniref:Uncharacterized protein n=1 Tax=Sunxiuqinia elliptica TaxID=655355 RepID=A0A4R6HCD0_9BACT|nr:hypothetical protein DET52_1011012 [Sunxiuqinia elliptica]TDO65192.1 hypothetical protein DET65_1570 [Sunxiuqinia elliptica]
MINLFATFDHAFKAPTLKAGAALLAINFH